MQVDEVLVILEDSMAMIGTILSSRFVAGIRSGGEGRGVCVGGGGL